MNKDRKLEITGRALEYFGLENQLLKLAEECGELSRAAVRMLQKEHDTRLDADYANLCEEIADVKILIAQIEPEFHEGVDTFIMRKLERLERRLNKELREGNYPDLPDKWEVC